MSGTIIGALGEVVLDLAVLLSLPGCPLAPLYFLPAPMRMPLKFGNQVLTGATCARAAVQIEDDIQGFAYFCNASSVAVVPSSVWTLSMRMGVGFVAMIRSTASIPSIPGMRTSVSTRCSTARKTT